MTTVANPLRGPAEPGALPRTERELRSAFLAEVERISGGGRLNHCIQCGTCTGSCPVSYAMDISPRQVIAMFRAGAIEELLRSRTIWICASCYHCTLRCPAEIKVTALLYALKRIAIERGIFPRNFPVHTLSEAFTEEVRRRGRNHELGLILRYYLRTRPTELLRRPGQAFRLWRHGRLGTKAESIRGIDGLRRIIARAETFDEPQERVTREKTTRDVGYAAIRG